VFHVEHPESDPRLPSARHLFGDRAGTALAYDELLRTEGVTRGLVGPREAARMWDRHVVNCAVVADACPSDASVVDVGSGAGLPGLVLALARPDLSVVLLEPLLRRTTFLSEVVERLAIPNVTVQRARAEEVAGQLSADVVTARAVAPLTRLVGWCLPLVRTGGRLLAIKGDRAHVELTEVADGLAALGATAWSVTEHGRGVTDPPVRVVRIDR
jgi:16S rRNA (guanine527-N7)-methyltransferase